MDKKYVFLGVLAVLATIAGLSLLYFTGYGASWAEAYNASPPEPGYIGSKIYLTDSSISYGTFNESHSAYPNLQYVAVQGEPCVIIKGTVRNDDSRDGWIGVTARIYDSNGESVGTVITHSTKPWFQTVYVQSNTTEAFEIPIKYYKRDITRYEVSLNFGLSPSPPP